MYLITNYFLLFDIYELSLTTAFNHSFPNARPYFINGLKFIAEYT